eukprot:84809-Chlamydomonas_euryale.AAC.4
MHPGTSWAARACATAHALSCNGGGALFSASARPRVHGKQLRQPYCPNREGGGCSRRPGVLSKGHPCSGPADPRGRGCVRWPYQRCYPYQAVGGVPTVLGGVADRSSFRRRSRGGPRTAGRRTATVWRPVWGDELRLICRRRAW